MTTNTVILASAEFVANLTYCTATGKAYRRIESYANGSSLAECLGDLEDLSDAYYVTLLSDDRARCTLA